VWLRGNRSVAALAAAHFNIEITLNTKFGRQLYLYDQNIPTCMLESSDDQTLLLLGVAL
jgi:hypothetical protein